jgi:hypothetical protein
LNKVKIFIHVYLNYTRSDLILNFIAGVYVPGRVASGFTIFVNHPDLIYPTWDLLGKNYFDTDAFYLEAET